MFYKHAYMRIYANSLVNLLLTIHHESTYG